MSSCKGCGVDSGDTFCDICHILIPALHGRSMELMPDENSMDEAAASIRLERGHRGEFWSALDSSEGTDIWWVLNPQKLADSHWIIDPPQPWALDDEMKAEIERGRIFSDDFSARRRLQRGGILPDGSYLTWADDQFWLDGVPLSVPYLTLEKMLERHDADQINWKALLVSMNVASSRFSPNQMRLRQFRGRQGEYGREISYHPVTFYLKPSRFDEGTEPNRAYLNRMNRGMEIGIPRSLIENLEWFKRWDGTISHANYGERRPLVCLSFSIKKGRLLLKMRNGMKWMTRRLPADPILIARILNWALSPVAHPEHQFLRCLQYGLLTPPDLHLDEENRRGVEFLRAITDNEKVRIDSENNQFMVRGISGVLWSVTPGPGPHGSRFRVRPREINGHSARTSHPREHLCVVETDELRALVLGDAIGTVILSLLDDIGSAAHIDTLQPVLRQIMNENFQRVENRARRDRDRARVDDQELDEEIRARNQAERMAVRATVIFPRFWSVLLRLPLNSRLAFADGRGDDMYRIEFAECDTTLRIRNVLEHELSETMLRAAGWERVEDVNEHGVRRPRRDMFTRVRFPQRDLGEFVHQFGELLEPLITIRQRMRLMPGPAWANFERMDPGVGQLGEILNRPLDE